MIAGGVPSEQELEAGVKPKVAEMAVGAEAKRMELKLQGCSPARSKP